jgi:hypothetical protein
MPMSRAAVDGDHGVAERHAGQQVERQRDRGKLPLMVDCQRRWCARKPGDGRERHELTRTAGDVDRVQCVRMLPVLRRHFHDDAVLIHAGVHRRDLPLAERVVERLVDGAGRDAEPRRGVAIDDHAGLQAAVC